VSEPSSRRAHSNPADRRRVLDAWLEHEHLAPGERIDRLAGDADLEALLREQGFEGDDWDVFVHLLAEYGVGVIKGWIRTRVIVQRCAEKNVKAPHLPLIITDDPDARESIADEAVAEAIYHFRDDVLAKGVWDPAKGAALRTFFVGQCLFRYPNAAKKYRRDELPQDADELSVNELDATEIGRIVGVEDDAIRMYTAGLLLQGASNERAARALALDACSYSNAEIASDMGISIEAVKSILKRERARLRQSNQAQRGSA
jgi:hypothetical protein